MSTAKSAQTLSLYQVVADMQETMEDNGLSLEVVDAIVMRGIEVLLGRTDDGQES